MKKSIITLLVSLFYSMSCLAQIAPPRKSPFATKAGSDYYVGLDRGKPLIRVNLLSGVAAPGSYHIPIDTDISELLSYAGGAIPSADLSEIQVRSKTKDGGYVSKRINLDSDLSGQDSLLRLKDQDVIYISQNDSIDNTIKWLTMASLAASIITAIVIIDDRD